MKKTIFALMLAGALALTACSDDTEPTAEPETSVPAEVDEVQKTPEPTKEPKEPELKLSERGNAIKKIGETAGVLDENDSDSIEDAWLQFKVTDIVVDGECTAEFAEPSENGHMVFVKLSASTATQWPADMQGQTIDFGYEWSVVGADGLTESAIDTEATYGCLPEQDMMPMTGIGPGEKVTGTIVLDSKNAKGTLVFKPWFLLEGGWEWKY